MKITTTPQPCCVLCATNAGLLQTWLDTKGLELRGYCAGCCMISATVVLPFVTRIP